MHTRVGALVAVVLVGAGLAGCGSKQDTARRRLGTYLVKVNAIERGLATPLTTVNRVDLQLTRTGASGHGTSPRLSVAAATHSLDQAESEIHVVSGRLAALPAPPQAAHLKALLLELVRRQADLTEQTSRLVVFIPAFARSLSPLARAVTDLERVLSVNRASGAAAIRAVYARKAAALRAFVATLARIRGSLHRLQPPASSRPTYVAELRSLNRMSAASSALASDLASGSTTGLSGLLQSFDRAAALPGSVQARRAEITAVRAYDRRVTDLTTLVADANRERQRLAQRYP